MNTLLPTPKFGWVQLTAPPLPTAGVVQDQPATAGSDTNVRPAGSVVLQLALEAASGPVFATEIVYVRVLPAITGSGESLRVTARSEIANRPTSTGS